MAHLTALLLALSSPAVLPQVPSPPAAASLSAGDQARRALQAAVAKSIVTVTAYERVPDGVAHEGRWAVADESAYPGFARAVVSSGIVVGNGFRAPRLECGVIVVVVVVRRFLRRRRRGARSRRPRGARPHRRTPRTTG
jgi:hypothetical protein